MQNILEAIGNTPLVKINRMNPNPNVNLYAKLEGFNPGGSVKDRIGFYMIEEAEKAGQLDYSKVIIEPTSGNTGIGLAIVAAVKGYKVIVVMPETMSVERRKVLNAYGADFVLSDGSKGMQGAIEKAHQMLKEYPDKYFMPNQFANKNNVLAHYETTGKEIWEQTNGDIDMFIAGIGTTGTLMGVSKRLKEYNPEVKIIGIEPYENHKIQGLKCLEDGEVPAIFDVKWVDEIVNINDEDAFQTARLLAKKEGIFAGISSGAAMHIALQKVQELKKGNIVVLFPDGGDRYLSTDLCN